jgi:hypothetical protein
LGIWSFPGLKLPGRGVDHPHPSSTEVKERVELYLYTTVGVNDPFCCDFYLYPYLIAEAGTVYGTWHMLNIPRRAECVQRDIIKTILNISTDLLKINRKTIWESVLGFTFSLPSSPSLRLTITKKI